MAYDVFISYRRDGGGTDARLMYERLQRAGFKVSFDMDTLKNGNFNEELLKRIAECKNFIVLLSAGCFDRTLQGQKRENDWLRLYNVGRCYAFGIGCGKDLDKAVMWLELAASLSGDFDDYDRKAAELLKELGTAGK